MQHLPARQRAVLLLREVLGFTAAEVATALATTVPSVNSALQRARKATESRLPEQSQQATLRALGDDGVRAVVGHYMDAWERGDIDAVVAMLTEDAILAMPPTATWYRGRDAIADFYRRVPLSGALHWRHVATAANGQPAVGCYAWDADHDAFLPMVLDVLTLRDTRVSEITAFLSPERFADFGLPADLRPEG